MGSILKIMAITSPVIFFLLYYVVVRQQSFDVRFDQDTVKFEQEWARMAGEMTTDLNSKKQYRKQITAAEAKIRALEEEKNKRKKKEAEIESEFDKTLENRTMQKQ